MNRLSTMCVVVAVFGVACAPPNLGDPQRSASKTLGVEGGEVLAKNGVGVVVPKGALSKAVLITVAPGEASHPAPPGIPVGDLYEFSPEGLSFSIPAKVRLEVDLSRLPAGYSIGNIVVQRAPLGTSSFERLTTRVVDATHVEADTLHFSVFVPTLEGVGGGGNDGGTDGGTTMCSETCGAGNDAGVDCSCARTCGQTLWEIECSGSSPLGCACVRNGVQVSSLSLPVCPGVGDIARYCDVQDGGVDGGSDGGVFTDGGVSDGGSDGGVFTDGGSPDGGSDGGVFTDGGVDGGSDGGVFTDGGVSDGGFPDGGSDGGVFTDGGTDGGFSDGGSDGGVFTDGGVDGGADGGTRDGGADAGP
jgi:hypothetical protein